MLRRKSVADADLGGPASRIAENIAGTVKDVADDVVKTAFNPSRNPNILKEANMSDLDLNKTNPSQKKAPAPLRD